MLTHYIVSDTHLADGSGRDDFKKNRTRFKNFLRFVRKKKARLVIAGDFLELWQAHPAAITRAYSDILNELIALQATIVIGNHDYFLTHFRKLTFLHDSYRLPGTKVIVKHGHQFDRFNDPERFMRIANLAALAAGHLEDIYPDFDETALGFLKHLQKDLAAAFRSSPTPGTGRKEYLDRGGDLSEYLRGARALLKKYDYCILGHTHEAGTAFDGRYLNAGCWTSDTPTYVEVNSKGQCSVRHWPGRRPVTELLAA